MLLEQFNSPDALSMYVCCKQPVEIGVIEKLSPLHSISYVEITLHLPYTL